jgi:hypothetical protein
MTRTQLAAGAACAWDGEDDDDDDDDDKDAADGCREPVVRPSQDWRKCVFTATE